ncbi:MAG: HAMP domain-containing protein, partial [Methylococcaceae bacterium]|nr:HAMP domain-containing protein [Methylococcaceae bacterium]
MKTLQTKTIAMLSCMLVVALVLAVLLILNALNERHDAERYGMMEKIAGNLNAMAGWQGIERGTGAVIIGETNPSAAILNTFDDVVKKVDAEAQLASSEIKRLLESEADADIEKKFTEWLSILSAVQSSRSKVKAAQITSKEWISVTTKNVKNAFALRAIVFSPHNPREKVFYYNAVVRANVATLCEYAGRERATLAAIIATGNSISFEQRDTLKFWRSIVDDNVEKMLALKTLSTTPTSLVEGINHFEKEFLGPYQQLRKQIYAASANETTYPVNSTEWIESATKAIDTGLAISNVIGNISAEAAKDINFIASSAIILNFALFGVAVLVFSISIYALRFLIIKPIVNLVTVIEAIAAGDLSVHIPPSDRQDEIGLLTNAAKTMQSEWHKLILDVYAHSASVHTAAQQIVSSIEEQAATTNQMSASVAEITSTME